MSKLIVICGPTASGKTKLALELATELGCSILNADSRQIYQEMDIGTAKPRPEEQALTPHYGLDLISPDTPYSAAKYAEYALTTLEALFRENDTQILCGGTGLYIQAVCEGMDEIPATRAETRTSLQQQYEADGLGPLLEQLKSVDPVTWKRIDRSNPRRVLRALEVYTDTGKPMSEWQQQQPKPRPFSVEYRGIEMDRQLLYRRIEERVDQMLAEGLVEEVKTLLKKYPADAPGLRAIGYKEVVAHLNGELDYSQLVDKIKQHTRNYAKRQLTWFRRNSEIRYA